ncbi:tyrosine-protein phosphatase [Rhodococcus erythropolis]|uniref:tyrosine-protein phosphatase n=1 Tax=Rhodococcus erythropolis TaxID=1833 RepID=UPI0033B22910
MTEQIPFIAPAPPKRHGIANFRDIGGIRTELLTEHGGTVGINTRTVFRSAAPLIRTRDEIQSLSAQIKTRIDLRTRIERDMMPVPLLPGVKTVTCDVLGPAPASLIICDDLPGQYRAFVEHAGCRRRFGEAFRAIARSRGPVLLHCTHGKDRTGWLMTVLYTIVGVSREAVDAEYLSSNYYLSLGPQHHTACSLNLLGIAFHHVETNYKDMLDYVHRGCGVGMKDVAALRKKLIDAPRGAKAHA